MFSTFNKDYLFFMIWLLVLVSVIIITLFYEIESTSFYGIAETRELVANSENSVEIKRINVVEGQAIVKGQLVVELISPELNMKINYISHQLDQLKAQKGVSKTELKSKINQLKAEKATKRNEINNQVKRLENELKINKALTAGLKSIKTNKTGIPTKTGANNPMQLRIESLRQELAFSLNPLNIQIDLYQQELDASDSPIKIRIERLGKELELLALENNKLNIYSQLTGVIGSINYKPGEKVVPFAPILTFHTKNPLFIKGFINENVYTNVQTGEELKVRSVSDSQRVISGKVVGVGSRIIEYPVRLRRHPDLQVWGREIIIKIPENNSFILGEKVIIDATNNKTSIIQKLKKVLSLNVAHSQNHEDQDIRIKEKDIVQIGEILTIVPKQTKNIEASGLLYLKDIDLYLVVSDDTPKNKFILFLMNDKGQIIKETNISDLSKISDIESITADENGLIFIASSLSENKKGKIKKSHRVLAVVSRIKDEFKLIKKIDLYTALENAAHIDQKKPWAKYILKGIKDHSIDIEGMFCRNDTLYLGFKTPFINGESVILKIEKITDVLKGSKFDNNQVSIWQTLKLKVNGSSIQERISDLYYDNDQLYITGSISGKKSGSLWKFDSKSGKAIRSVKFDNMQPEGIAAGKKKGTLMVCFDQGKNNKSKIYMMRIMQ